MPSSLNGQLYLLYSFRTNSSIIFLCKEEMECYFICVFAMVPNIINDRENIISDTFAQEGCKQVQCLPENLLLYVKHNHFSIRLCFFSLDIFFAIFTFISFDKMKIIKNFQTVLVKAKIAKMEIYCRVIAEFHSRQSLKRFKL